MFPSGTRPDRFIFTVLPCHSRVGEGRHDRAARIQPPPNFHGQRLRNAPLGYFYDVMSNGFGAMPDMLRR